ncbi:MAG: hypothetical protein QOF49_1287, partial [Chloroflexota bacterium]|nr:hypothetical protein [Chloroflexota bacterium]
PPRRAEAELVGLWDLAPEPATEPPPDTAGATEATDAPESDG